MFTVNVQVVVVKKKKMNISKHFMFTVNNRLEIECTMKDLFQNISCLRLIGRIHRNSSRIDDRLVSALGKEDGKFPLTEAVKGNIYYFPGNKKFYICKEAQNRRVSVPDGNFEELSIWENRKRLENFSKLEGERLYVPNATFVKVYKIAGMVTLIVDSGTAFFNKANTPIFNLPEKYRPNETLYFSASYRNNTKSNTFFLFANGDLIKSEVDDNLGAYYFTISYPAKS